MVDRAPDPVPDGLFSLRILSGPMVGTETPLESGDYVIVASDEAEFAVAAHGASTADGSASGRASLAYGTSVAALPDDVEARTLWVPSHRGSATLRLELREAAQTRDFTVVDCASGDAQRVALQHVVAHPAVHFALKPIDEAWSDAVLQHRAGRRVEDDAVDSAAAFADAGEDHLGESDPDRAATLLAQRTPQPASESQSLADAGAPPRSPARAHQIRRLLAGMAMICATALIAAGAAGALPGDLTRAHPPAPHADPLSPIDAAAAQPVATQQTLASLMTARRKLESALIDDGLPLITVRLLSDARLVVVLDGRAAQPTQPATRTRVKRLATRVTPAIEAVEIEYAEPRAVLAAAKQVFAEASLPYRERHAGRITRIIPAANPGDATLHALREPLRLFHERWGDRLVQFDLSPPRDPTDGKSRFDGTAGYVLLAPGHWYFPDTVKG